MLAFPVEEADPTTVDERCKLPNEEAARDAIRGAAPGQYVLPHVGIDWKGDEARVKYEEGPNAFLTVVPSGVPTMGGKLLATMVFNIVVALFCAYLGSLHLAPGAGFGEVFRFVGTAGVMAYVFGGMQGSIWFGKPRSAIVKDVIDGVAYGLITGVVFAAMWPGA